MSEAKICPQCGAEYAADQRFCPSDGSTLRLPGTGTDLVGSIVADRYHVLRKLGEGGMGQVYLAEHVKMGRRSALKVLNAATVRDADAVSRFNREAANASRISHPNVAAIYDFGETDDGIIYLAMELVEGVPLTQLVAQQGPLPPLRAAEITRQTAEALSAAHDLGIVHRDLKPDNVMIARTRDGADLVKVVDFGIAKGGDSAAQKVTKTGLVVGTPEYMSPEQLAGDRLDGRSDIYALGLVAFNMLTGRLPFTAETVQESLIMRLTETPMRLAEIRAEVGWTPEVQAVLDRALARDAGKRYATASEFGRALYRAIEQMPVSKSAGMPTEVMPATPATSGARIAPVASAAVIPPTRVAPSTSGVRATAGAAPRGRRLLLAAAAVVVVGSAAGAAAIRAHAARVPATVMPQGSALAAIPPGATAAESSLASSHGSTAAASHPASAPNARHTTGGAAHTGRDAAEVAARLAAVDALTDPKTADSVSARRALAALDRVAPAVSARDDSLHAAVLRARAYIELQQNGAACGILKGITAETQGTTWRRTVTTLRYYACQ